MGKIGRTWWERGWKAACSGRGCLPPSLASSFVSSGPRTLTQSEGLDYIFLLLWLWLTELCNRCGSEQHCGCKLFCNVWIFICATLQLAGNLAGNLGRNSYIAIDSRTHAGIGESGAAEVGGGDEVGTRETR
eukprot:1838051-Rhodomonas_salina.1